MQSLHFIALCCSTKDIKTHESFPPEIQNAEHLPESYSMAISSFGCTNNIYWSDKFSVWFCQIYTTTQLGMLRILLFKCMWL